MRVLDGDQFLVRIFLGESDLWQHTPLARALLERPRLLAWTQDRVDDVHDHCRDRSRFVVDTLTVHMNGTEHALAPGDAMYFDSTVPHAYRRGGRAEMPRGCRHRSVGRAYGGSSGPSPKAWLFDQLRAGNEDPA